MMFSLRQLHSDDNVYSGEHSVAYADHANISWDDFLARSGHWDEKIAQCPSNSVAIYHQDGFEFATLLLACWRNNKTAVIPANTLAATCFQLSEITPLLLGEFPPNINLSTTTHNNEQTTEPAAITIFTSGSSGQPTPIDKSFAQLDNEIQTLEDCWGNTLGSSVITGTVSHHHIYGLLFRILWPLCAGRTFISRERSYWEEVIQDAKRFEKLSLIASPAHYKNMPALNWSACASSITMAFSSGAPLPLAAAQHTAQALEQAVIEIYGSSETGGIAWREQTTTVNWTALPNVFIRLDETNQQLSIQSPHLPNNNWYLSADKAEFDNDGKFNLLGRVDKIAKVAGKRISLSSVEDALLRHPWVAQVKVIPLSHKQERLGAAVVLNSTGNSHLIDQGKLAINKTLQQHLAGEIEAVASPRYWRYIANLPENPQGKTTAADVELLFHQVEEVKFPRLIRNNALSPCEQHIELFIPAELYYFNGHFLGRPILPGVVQIHWAIHYAKQYFGQLTGFQRLEKIKFQQVIIPNQSLLLSIRLEKDNHTLHFSYSANNTTFSSGRIVFTGSNTS